MRHYGWVIVAVATISMLAIYGIRHSFAAFFPPILDEFGWTRGSTAFMFSLNVLFYGLLAPVSGSLADRWRPKLVMSAGVLLLGLSTAGCALASELWHFYVLFGVLMPLGTAFAGAPVFVPALANWFTEKRGMAIGLGFAGGGLSFSMNLYANSLISILGWRWAYVVMAGTLVGIVIPLVLFLFRYRPKSPIAETGEVSAVAPKIARSELTAVQILRDHRLWLLVLAYMLYMGVANYLVVAHQVVFAEDLGYSSLFAASVAGLYGIFVALGGAAGFIADRFGRERAFTLSTILSVSSLLILLLQRDASQPWTLYLFALGFGFGMGLVGPSIIAGAADLFHGKHFGMVNGLIIMGVGIGGAIGPWLGGHIFDLTGSYTTAFVICIVAYSVACVIFWLVAPRKAARLAVKAVPAS